MPKTTKDWGAWLESYDKVKTKSPSSSQPTSGTFFDPMKKRREYWKETRYTTGEEKPTFEQWESVRYNPLFSGGEPDPTPMGVSPNQQQAPPGSLVPSGEQAPPAPFEPMVHKSGGTLTRSELAETERRYQEGDKEIDVMTGASSGDRFWTSFMRDTKDRMKFYQNKYGEDSIRVVKNKDGGDVLVLRKPDGTDLLVDEEQASDKDLVDLAGYIPEVAGAIAGMGVAGKLVTKAAMRPFVKWIIEAGASAATGQGVGAIQDAAVRASVGNEIQPWEIAAERGRRTAEDFVFDIATGGFVRVAKGGINLAANPGRIFPETYKGVSEQAIKVRDELYELSRTVGGKNAVKNGIDIPLDPATLTGSEFVQRMEAMLLNLPGSAPMKQMVSDQKDAQMRMFKMLTGDVDEITDEQIGKLVIPVIEKKINDVGEYVEVVREKVVQSGLSNLDEFYKKSTASNPFVRSSYKRVVGDSVIAEAKLQRDLFKKQSGQLYDAAANGANAAGNIFDMTAYKSVVQKNFSEIMKTEGGDPALEVLSPKLREFLSKANDYPDKVSFNEIKSLRVAADAEIAEGVAMRNVNDTRLIELSKVLQTTIEEAGGNKAVQQQLKAANLFYKKHNDKFRSNLFNSMFKDVEKGGLGGEALIDSLVTGKSANYLELKNLLGERFSVVRSAALDGIMQRFRSGDTVDAAGFLKFLKDPKAFNKEVRDDLLGSNSSRLMSELELLNKVKDPRASVDDLESLIKSGSVSRAKVEKLISARKHADKTYERKFLRPFLEGRAEAFNPQDFVNHFLFTGGLSDVKDIVTRLKRDLNPQVHSDLKRKVVFQYFQMASKGVSPEDLTNKGMLVDPVKMRKLLSGGSGIKDADKKLKAVLEPDEYQFFHKILEMNEVLAKTQHAAAAKVAGGLATGSIMNQFMVQGPLKVLPQTAKYWIYSSLLSNRPVRKWMQNNFRIEDSSYLAKVLVTAPPFVNAFLQDGNYEAGAERVFGNVYKAATLVKEELTPQDLTPTDSASLRRPSPETRSF